MNHYPRLLGLATILAASACYAAEGMAGSPATEPSFFVHAEDAEGVLMLDANGRIMTDLNDRPEWAHGLAVALLHERIKHYTDRLGAEGAKAHLGKNTLNVEDLCWVAFDEAGDEVEVQASSEFRVQVLATELGVDGEGEIHGAIAERTIAEDNRSWDAEKAFQDPNAATRTGTEG